MTQETFKYDYLCYTVHGVLRPNWQLKLSLVFLYIFFNCLRSFCSLKLLAVVLLKAKNLSKDFNRSALGKAT
jgi:hypothetical protein